MANVLNDMMERGELQAAFAEATGRIAKNPNDAEALTAIAKLHVIEGALTKAFEFLTRAEALGDTVDTKLVRATILADQGDFDDAVPYWEQALKDAPNRYEAYFALGMYWSFRDLPTSQQYFEKAIERCPENGLIYFHLARVMYEQDDEKAGQPLTRALELNPYLIQAYLVASRMMIGSGHLEDARALLLQGLQAMPDNPQLMAELSNVSLIGGDVGAAFVNALANADRFPDDERAQAQLALNLLAQQKFSEVATLVMSLVRKGVASSQLRAIEGMAREAMDPPDIKGAVKAYKAAMSMDLAAWQPANNLGLLQLNQGDLVAAEEALAEAHKRNPERAEPRFNLALVAAKQGKRDEAIEAARQVVGLAPKGHALHDQAVSLIEALQAPA